ncbi:MAG: Glu-tRNA(Gln) amidotransferase subunit GatD [Candidatus Hodarchaeales archaeon]|jgi:glutamyl-tRNA(Gln) amidotransferase subunit D
MNDEYQPPEGYRGKLLERLVKEKVSTWSHVRVRKKNSGVFEGVVLPRSVHTDNNYLNLKVDTGYNVGITIKDADVVEIIGYKKGQYKIPPLEQDVNEQLPMVTLLGTGGTVASRLDYRTGAVLPAFTPEELFAAVPELTSIVNLTPITIYQILSENFKPEYWVRTAEAVTKEIENGAEGVIIGHGTDTMGYTGSFLAYALRDLPVPVVIVGSQRSSDRPSSDGPINIINASILAGFGDFAEVVVCMHGTTSDNYDLIHRGVRVRKMHSSRRDAFKTIGDIPLGMIKDRKITFFKEDRRRRGQQDSEGFHLDIKHDKRVAVLYSYPGMHPDMIHSVVDNGYHGLVIIGTGLGHVGSNMYESLKRMQEEEIPVVMVVQPLYGYAHLRVYETGRDLLALGIIEGGNMIPSAAYAKLVWTLGHTRDVKEVQKIMQTNIAGEITSSESTKGYLIYQGIEPRIEKLMERL